MSIPQIWLSCCPLPPSTLPGPLLEVSFYHLNIENIYSLFIWQQQSRSLGNLQAGESCKVNSLNNEKRVPRITSNCKWSFAVCAGVQQSHGVSSCFPFPVLPYINELARKVQEPLGLQTYTFPSKMTLHRHLQDSHSQNAQLLWPALITWYFPNFKEGRKCIYFYSLK